MFGSALNFFSRMNQEFIIMTTNILLTTGVYDLVKDHLRRKKVTQVQEEILLTELRNAKQVLRKDLPEEIVTIGKKVTLKDLSTNQEMEYNFVGPDQAKPKKNRHSILMDEGLATVGYKTGDIINWPTAEGDKKYQILNVE